MQSSFRSGQRVRRVYGRKGQIGTIQPSVDQHTSFWVPVLWDDGKRSSMVSRANIELIEILEVSRQSQPRPDRVAAWADQSPYNGLPHEYVLYSSSVICASWDSSRFSSNTLTATIGQRDKTGRLYCTKNTKDRTEFFCKFIIEREQAQAQIAALHKLLQLLNDNNLDHKGVIPRKVGSVKSWAAVFRAIESTSAQQG